MRRNPLTYRSALTLSIGISLLVNLLFFIIFFYGRNAVMPPSDQPARHLPDFDLIKLGVNFVSVFIFAFAMYILNFKLLKSKLPPRTKIFVIIVSSAIVAFLLSNLMSWIQIQLFCPDCFHHRIIRGGLMKDLFIATAVVFSSQLFYLVYRKQEMALENETLILENVKTRYLALKNQVDPHFLFNSLNTLNSIIKTDPDKAQEYVQQLALVFRYTLQNKEVISLSEELRFTHAYCSLMQIRYGESLSFGFDIDDIYKGYSIVPLSIQTLVENAIKHNVITNKQPLHITISTSDDDTLSVSNPIQLKKEAEPGEGIGLANLAERYRLMWQREIEVKAGNDVFEVIIPLIKP